MKKLIILFVLLMISVTAIQAQHYIPNENQTLRYYTINTNDSDFVKLFQDTRSKSYIKKGSLFDFDLMEKERWRLISLIREKIDPSFCKDNLVFIVNAMLSENDYDITIEIQDNCENSLVF